MSDREIYDIEVMGLKWCVQLHFHDFGFDKAKYISSYPNISINFSNINSIDELVTVLFDALFDGIIDKFCEEDDWGSKILANVASQIFTNPKSRRVIDEMCTYFSRNSMFGDEYEKFNADGTIETYMFDSIEILKPHHWGFEIWIASLEGEDKYEFSRFGMSEEYVFSVDPTKFKDGNEICECLDKVIKDSSTGDFEGLGDIQSSYAYDKLIRKLKATNINDIKTRFVEEYDDIVSEF